MLFCLISCLKTFWKPLLDNNTKRTKERHTKKSRSFFNENNRKHATRKQIVVKRTFTVLFQKNWNEKRWIEKWSVAVGFNLSKQNWTWNFFPLKFLFQVFGILFSKKNKNNIFSFNMYVMEMARQIISYSSGFCACIYKLYSYFSEVFY